MFADRRKGETSKKRRTTTTVANGDKISEAAKQRINANIFACTLHIDMHNNTSTQHTATPHHTNFAKLDAVARARTPQKRKLAQAHTECKVRQETAAASAAVSDGEEEDEKKTEAKHEIDCLRMRAHGRLYAKR